MTVQFSSSGVRWSHLQFLPGERKTIHIAFQELARSQLVCCEVSHPGIYLESAKMNGEEHLVLGAVPIELYGLQAIAPGETDFEDPMDAQNGVLLELILFNETQHAIRLVLELRRIGAIQ